MARESFNGDDRQLVKAALKNERDFAVLIEKYEEKLRRFLLRYLGSDRDEIDDVLQEIFIKVFRYLNNYDEKYKFSSWIYRIGRNEVFNYLKSKRRKTVISLDGEGDDGMRMVDLLVAEIDLKENYEKSGINDRVRGCLEALPMKYKEPLLLKYIEEKDYNEISDILEKPSGTVATLINRGKKMLRKLLIKAGVNE